MARRRRSVFGRLFRLTLFVAVLFGGYTAAWLYAAHLVEKQAAQAIADARGQGREAECTNLRTDGFPLELTVACDSVAFTEPPQGLAVVAGGLTATGRIYDPLRLDASVSAPARIELAGQPAVELDWGGLSASTKLARPVPEEVTLQGSGFSARRAGRDLLTVGSFRWVAVPNGKDLVVRCALGGIALDAALVDGRSVPPLDAACDLTVKDGMRLLADGTRSLRGRSVSFRELALTTAENAGFGLAGWIGADAQGLVDADLQVTPKNPQALAGTLAAIVPEHADTIRTYANAVAALGPDTPFRITVNKGVVWFTLFRVGELPPVD